MSLSIHIRKTIKAVYINHYLTDTDVANFARQSFAKLADNFSQAQNNSLIRFLARGMSSGDWDNIIECELPCLYYRGTKERQALAVYLRKIPEHWVPFGHPHITLRMTAPIPIRVQCFKHKIGYVESEESRRYIKTRPELYIPENIRAAAESVKQGSGGIHKDSDNWLETYKSVGDYCISIYEQMVAQGVCPEQARFILPQGCEVNWVWTGSLYAFANFYNQRSDSHAQKEIQDLAEQCSNIISPLYPISWAALTQGSY